MTSFKLKHDKVWDEYRVEVYENGKKNEARTYYTSDRDDAIETLATMQEESK